MKKMVRRWAVTLGIFRPVRSLFLWFKGDQRIRDAVEFHKNLSLENKLVFDIGANRGQSSEVYLKLGARVVAFEPQTNLHKEILQTCRHNPKLTIEPLGLGATEEDRKFFMTSYDQVASLRDDWVGDRVGETTISVSTLDSQIKKFGVPHYCKIDVEGWELEVVEGLNQPIPLISFEYHNSPPEIEKARAVLERLATLGNYHCNVKQGLAKQFAFSSFISLKDFINQFPDDLETTLTDHWGDIFCSLNPNIDNGSSQ